MVPTPKTAEAWRSARLRLVWEGDDPELAGVDLPLGAAFGLPERSMPYRSLLVGRNAMTWYNYFPMPYRRQALLQIEAEEPIKGKVRVRTLPGVDPRAGYFRAGFRASLPAKPGADFEWLSETGRGHLAGLLLEVEAPGKSSRPLDASDRVAVDGFPAVVGSRLAHRFNGSGPGVTGRLDRPQTYPLSGFPEFRQEGDALRAAAYRWHLTDPVPFERSVTAEIAPDRESASAAGYRAAAFWYSERPGPASARRRD